MDNLGTIGIVGAGGMGRGIAEVACVAGMDTVLVKATVGEADQVRAEITRSLDKAVARGKLTVDARNEALGHLRASSSLAALAPCRLVIESVVEDLATKQALLPRIEENVSPACIIASNTSSLPLQTLADSLRAPVRFLGLHFFSPVPAMKLVEIAATQRTYPNAVEVAQAFVAGLGKTPVMVGDSSGYIVNRLLVPYLLDGLSALEDRVAPAASIDLAMKLGCGHPVGPLQLADAIGLDVVYAMAKSLHKELGDRRYSAPALLRRLVTRGWLGKKSGRGVYDYATTPPSENAELWPMELSA